MNVPVAVQLSKEFKFGKVMLKRTKRELCRLAEEMKTCDIPEEAAKLRLRFQELQQSILQFEQELAVLQKHLESASASVS